MLELSRTQSTFLEEPSTLAHFDYKAMLPTCMAALREDEALRQRRFELVPKRVDEITFWRNYFDKVHAIKDAILATSVHLNSIGSHAGGDAPAPRRSAPPPPAPAAQPTEADGRADAMAERIRRELDELDVAVPSAPAADDDDDEGPSEPAGAPPPRPSPASAAPAAPTAAPPAFAPAAADTPPAPTAEQPIEEAEEEEDDGVELSSDDDIDKLLDLDDDDELDDEAS
ncbi:hypothetical protein T492DRAFT_963068 [Pavlovales sp. CCMP2436]|nr:hypothetical protein T492DRAFT_963068 [Pavlovales sp. CCMP2436]